MRVLIIEDEVNVRSGFIKMINTFCDGVEVVGFADGVASGRKLITDSEFDLLFLDINLIDGTGFDLLYYFPNRDFKVIFVTAYDQFAIDAFKVSASDYLMKPVSPQSLRDSIKALHLSNDIDTKLVDTVLTERLSGTYGQDEKIIIRNIDSIQLIQINEIIFCEADGSYTKFYLQDNVTVIASLHLKEYERLLQPYGFERAHHSHLINLNHVKSIHKGESYITMSNNSNIPLSTRKRPVIIESIQKRYLG